MENTSNGKPHSKLILTCSGVFSFIHVGLVVSHASSAPTSAIAQHAPVLPMLMSDLIYQSSAFPIFYFLCPLTYISPISYILHLPRISNNKEAAVECRLVIFEAMIDCMPFLYFIYNKVDTFKCRTAPTAAHRKISKLHHSNQYSRLLRASRKLSSNQNIST